MSEPVKGEEMAPSSKLLNSEAEVDLSKATLPEAKGEESLVKWGFFALGRGIRSVARAVFDGVVATAEIAAPHLKNVFADEKIASAAATAGYKFLPPILKKVVPQPVFVAFCVSRREDVGRLVNALVVRKEAAGALPPPLDGAPGVSSPPAPSAAGA